MRKPEKSQFFQAIPALVGFLDNYIWYRADSNGNALLVDPGEAGPVIERLAKEGLTPTVILITHHHFDHVDGVAPLLERYPNIEIYGPQKTPLASISHRFAGGETLSLPKFGIHCEVIATPGHTLDHICYYSERDQWLLCGDTLFSAGCGRMFEGTAEQFNSSLQSLASLPADTMVYGAHEYTADNIKFAQAVEPNNPQLLAYKKHIAKLRDNGEPSLPSSMGLERQVNPFLRAGLDSVKIAAETRANATSSQPRSPSASTSVSTAAESFAILRAWKDDF